MTDRAGHGRRVDLDLVSPPQSSRLCPLHQDPLDPLPGRSLDLTEVLLQRTLARSPAPGQAAEPPKALRVGQVEGQLLVGQLLPVLVHRNAQDLLGAQARRTVLRFHFVRQIL